MEPFLYQRIEFCSERRQALRILGRCRDDRCDRRDRLFHTGAVVLRAERRGVNLVAIELQIGDRIAQQLADQLRIAPGLIFT